MTIRNIQQHNIVQTITQQKVTKVTLFYIIIIVTFLLYIMQIIGDIINLGFNRNSTL